MNILNVICLSWFGCSVGKSNLQKIVPDEIVGCVIVLCCSFLCLSFCLFYCWFDLLFVDRAGNQYFQELSPRWTFWFCVWVSVFFDFYLGGRVGNQYVQAYRPDEHYDFVFGCFGMFDVWCGYSGGKSNFQKKSPGCNYWVFIFCVVCFCIGVVCFVSICLGDDRAGNQYFPERSPGWRCWICFVRAIWIVWFWSWALGRKIKPSTNSPWWRCGSCFFSVLFIIACEFLLVFCDFLFGRPGGELILSRIESRVSILILFCLSVLIYLILIWVFGRKTKPSKSRPGWKYWWCLCSMFLVVVFEFLFVYFSFLFGLPGGESMFARIEPRMGILILFCLSDLICWIIDSVGIRAEIKSSKNSPGRNCWLCFFSVLFIVVFEILFVFFDFCDRAGNQYLQDLNLGWTFWFSFAWAFW